MTPQVLVVDGQIVINEKSLTVNAAVERATALSDFTRVEESGTKLNSATYANYTKAEKWSREDTEFFFQALRQFGTDFSLIQRLFPGRTRRQIKKKYLAEDKLNPERVEEAVRNLNPDVALYKNLIDVLRAPESAPDADENATAGGALAARGETDGATNVARAVLDGPRDLPIEGVAGMLPSNEGEERTETDGAATRGRPTAKAKKTPPAAAAAADKEKEKKKGKEKGKSAGTGDGAGGGGGKTKPAPEKTKPAPEETRPASGPGGGGKKPATEAGRGARGAKPAGPGPGQTTRAKARR
jgi:hypothetical protein